jgi:hypothetical protein
MERGGMGMMDKREADDLAVFDCAYMIGKILDRHGINNKGGMEEVQEAKDFIKLLRSHGWHHESDVVEGTSHCDDCPGMGCDPCKYYNNEQPLTVGDLIKRGE